MTEDLISENQGEGNSFKEIVMRQLNKVLTLSNVEFRGGFYSILPSKSGETKEVYVPDTRQVYCNAVYSLALLIRPRFDKKIIPEWEEYLLKNKKLEDEFISKTKLDEEVVLGESYYTEDEKKEWHTLQIKKLALHLKLFENLSLQLARLNYFEFGGETFE